MKYLFFIFIAILFSVELLAKPNSKHKTSSKRENARYPQEAYLDIEDNEIVTVFDKPGKNWKICEESQKKKKNKFAKTPVDGCEALAWADNGNNDAQNNTYIEILEPKEKHITTDEISGKEIEEEFYHVRVSYKRKYKSAENDGEDKVLEKKVVGYIDASFVKLGKRKEEKKRDNSPKQADDPNRKYHEGMIMEDLPAVIDKCNKTVHKQPLKCDKKELPLQKNIPDEKKIKQETHDQYDLNAETELLMDKVGSCVNIEKKDVEEMPTDKLTYDYFALPKLTNVTPPRIKKSNGKEMTREDLINIDAMARTLYGEVGGCFKDGLQHPMAVAKVIMNRTNGDNDDQYIYHRNHSDEKPRISKAATKPSQFNVWYKSHKTKMKDGKEKIETPNMSLVNSLCPIKPAKGAQHVMFYQTVWQKALRIATEAVLHPNEFSKKTNNHKYKEYTSRYGSEGHNGIEPVPLAIQGQRLIPSCVQLWK